MTSSEPVPRTRRSLTRRLERAGLAFETEILELRVQREPDNLELLAALAEACTRLRRYQQGLALDRQLVARAPKDPGVRYNLACSLSLTGDVDGAMAAPVHAVELGYDDLEHLDRDPDLRRLRADPRYPGLRERLARLAGDGGRAATAD
jgi:Flp pilus assembly protein TadD